MLLPKPLHQIEQPPAHDAIEIGNRIFLNRLDKRSALLVIQQRRAPLGLYGLQAIGTMQIEAFDPISHDLQTDPADRSHLTARTALVDDRQSKRSARPIRIPASPRQPAQVLINPFASTSYRSL